MRANHATPKNIDQYIASFPHEVQTILERLRMAIRKAAPAAGEAMKYGIPTFTLEGNLVHFGAFKKHVGFYPTPTGTAKFKRELSVYKGAKGSVQFPLGKPIPFGLVSRIVKFRAQENLARAKSRARPNRHRRAASRK